MANLLVWICIIFANLLFHAGGGLANKIQPELLSLLGKGERPNIFIFFKDGINHALEKAASLRHIAERGPRNEAIINTLEEHADASQAGILQTLTSQRRNDANQGFKYFKQYKSANMMFVEEATSDVIHSIAKDPNVAKIEKEPMFKLVQIEEAVKDKKVPEVRTFKDKPQYNLLQMQVPEAWEELGDAKRDHVVMGFIDTGVRYTHKALIDTFVGSNYGWYDPINKTSEPYEADTGRGHGTCMASIGIGSHYIGVAPGIKWMSCLGCNLRDCAAKWLMDCIEFMECPTLPDGTQRNCSKAPHVVNNSWESIRGETGYNNFILRWRELGITPVFAIGNRGAACGSTSAPGELPFVIGVGGSDDENIKFGLGGNGPAPDGKIKPDVIAPGVDIYCAGRYKDDDHSYGTGTSPASPHIAGVVALLKVRDPEITYDQIYNLLIQNTDTNITIKRYIDTCPEPADDIPNNFFGYGRVNALKVLKAQTEMLTKRTKKR